MQEKNWKAFTEFRIKNMVLKNRFVMPPMCMYSAKSDGKVTDFHQAHYMARALGGVGLIIVEAAGVMPNGRIADADLGIWDDGQIANMKQLTDNVKSQGAHIGIQINHSGRKHDGSGITVGPSPIPFSEEKQVPHELTSEEISEIIKSFGQAARRADEAGFDALEIHGAHGYLIHQFLSPMSNKRTDAYGGSREKRARFLKEVMVEVTKFWPDDKPLWIRVSATEYLEDGYEERELSETLNEISDMIDLIHVSSGGNGHATIPLYPGYQVKQSEKIKDLCHKNTIAVGLISTLNMVEEILSNDRAELVAIGRELLRNPSFVNKVAYENNIEIEYPEPYRRAYR